MINGLEQANRSTEMSKSESKNMISGNLVATFDRLFVRCAASGWIRGYRSRSNYALLPDS